ncbi:MAG: glyoxalase, partial [Nocardioides sp.]
MRAIHHIDLWVQHAATAMQEWAWLFTSCGWEVDFGDEKSGAWKHPDGTYAFLERSPDLRDQTHDRLAPGINHLAFCVADRPALDAMREQAA